MAVEPAVLIAAPLLALLSVLVVRKGMLTAFGGLTAWALGMVIVVRAGPLWLLSIGCFLLAGNLATRVGYNRKASLGAAEPRGGARRGRNVFANGIVPAGIAALAPWLDQANPGLAAVAFGGALAAAGADTLASELGTLSPNARLITTLERVPAGTDGGVSGTGQAAAAAGALTLGGLTLFLVGPLSLALDIGPDSFPVTLPLLLAATVGGFAGCQVDSLLGATLERRGWLTKEEVNASGILSGALVTVAVALLLAASVQA